MAEVDQENIWLREQNLIYSLMYCGWRKGVEQFKNRITVQIGFDQSVPPEDRERFIQELHGLLREYVPLEERA